MGTTHDGDGSHSRDSRGGGVWDGGDSLTRRLWVAATRVAAHRPLEGSDDLAVKGVDTLQTKENVEFALR